MTIIIRRYIRGIRSKNKNAICVFWIGCVGCITTIIHNQIVITIVVIDVYRFIDGMTTFPNIKNAGKVLPVSVTVYISNTVRQVSLHNWIV